MLCRVADQIFWMSRYVERAIAVGRLIEVTWHLELDAGDPEEADAHFWVPLLGLVEGADTPGPGLPDKPTAREIRHYLAFDVENPNSLVSCIRRARSAAREVRESISSEMWEQINTLHLWLVEPRLKVEAEKDPYTFRRRVREGALFFQGLVDCTLACDEPWHFIALGKCLERAANVARTLDLEAHLLTGGGAAPGGDNPVRWLAVLRSCGSAEAYARYYSMRVEPARVVEFLLLNPIFPQSVRFNVATAWRSLEAIAGPRSVASAEDPAVRALGLLRARLDYALVDEVLEEGLQAYLEDVQNRIAVVSDRVTRSYFRDEPQPGRLMAVARAAMIMAAQQQQQ